MRMIFNPVAILCLILSLGLTSSGRAQWIPDGVPIAAVANMQSSVQIVADGTGGAYLVWMDYRDPTSGGDIYMQLINSRGEPLWGENGIAIAEGTSLQKWPSLCLDTSGSAFVTYVDGSDIRAQRVNRDGDLLFGHNGVVVYEASTTVYELRIVAGTSASAIIGWSDVRNGNSDYFAQHVSAFGTISWSSDGVVICNAANDQGEMEMIADGSGGAIFVWEDNRDLSILPIYAQKINSSGTVQWNANGYRICGTNTWMYLPKLVSDGAGGAYIVWYDMRNGTDDNIWAQRMLSAGTRAWASAGVSVCSAAEEQTSPDIATDGAGGAIFAWDDARTNPPYADIYAQRFNSSGVAQWTANGVAVSDPAQNQMDPVIVSDGAGGAIIAWLDQLFSNAYDIRSQRINSSGVSQWLMQGENVCTAPLNQSNLQIISDGAKGAIMAWNDERSQTSMSWDIYAQRMERHGYWGYPCPLNPAGADVPYDQGGVALLAWDASYLDAFPEEIVTHYVIWRSTDGTSYSPLDSIDAYYLESYQFAAATTADSSGAGPATHYFKIRANTLMSDYWWESAVVTCHSVDNLSPAPPAALVAEQAFEPAGLALAWIPNGESDLDHYAVYRGPSADFAPCAENLIGAPTEASFFDASWRWEGGYFYKVSAVDANGNESEYAAAAPESVTGNESAGAPRATYLSQNFPNPFNPATRISFGLREPSRVSLRIYDAAGRLVRVLAQGDRAAGSYTELWNGRDDGGDAAASGIYFYRLDAGTWSETRKMVLLK